MVLRKKGVELTELEEEVGDLMDRHQLMEDNVGTSERELIEKVGGFSLGGGGGGGVWSCDNVHKMEM